MGYVNNDEDVKYESDEHQKDENLLVCIMNSTQKTNTFVIDVATH